jgi:hypothetical protein
MLRWVARSRRGWSWEPGQSEAAVWPAEEAQEPDVHCVADADAV